MPIDFNPTPWTTSQQDVRLRIGRARRFMDKYYDCPVSLNQIARQACFSPFHFIRIFRRTVGVTPHQYLIRKRIERAKWYLSRTDSSVTEICFQVGFQSLGSFSSLFHKLVGCSPSRYRTKCHQLRCQAAQNPEWAVPACFLSMYAAQTRLSA